MKVRKQPLRIWPTLGAALVVLVVITAVSLVLNPGSTEATPTTTPAGLQPDEVIVVNTATESVPVAGDVTVVNTATEPVPVAVQNSATDHQPWTWRDSIVIDAEDSHVSADEPFDIPPGKYLVIDFVSIDAGVPDPLVPRVQLHIINAGAPNPDMNWFTYPSVAVVVSDVSGDYRYYQLNEQVNFILEPSDVPEDHISVEAWFLNNEDEHGLVSIMMSGYTTDEL